MRRFLGNFTGFAVLVLILAPAEGRAADVISSEYLDARLISEQASVRPGDTVHIALHQQMAPKWHTYWRNPGDSGQAPDVAWEFPEGAEVGGWQWPLPERQEIGPMVNYGYSDETALLTTVTVPDDWQAGTPFPVAGEAEILVCEKICIPVTGRLSVEVPTGPATIPDPDAQALFSEARGRIPPPSPFATEAHVTDADLQISLAADNGVFGPVTAAYFFPDTWGLIDHAAAQKVDAMPGRLSVIAPRGQAAPGETVSGILAVREGSGANATRLAYRIENVPIVAGTAPSVSSVAPSLSLMLLFALLGGLLLNLMPCVFPVLAIKTLGLARQAEDGTRVRVLHGASYGVGVIVSFLALAAALLAARAAGEAVGWGFQLQSPLVVGGLAYVTAAVGFNLSGVFEIGGRFAGAGGSWAAKSGHVGSFATGVLAAVVATPCTAPFMAVAAGGALLLPVPGALAVFAVMGLGLALPYIALAASPALARRLPKPGPWMVRFRQVLAFPLYATAAWLIWVLAQQAGNDAAFLATLGLIALAFALWLLGVRPSAPGRLAAKARLASLIVMAVTSAGLLAWASGQSAETPALQAEGTLAEPFSMARLTELKAEGRPVFVNMTAAWCITCKVNERIALSGEDFAKTLKRHDIAYLMGDWTNRNPEITRLLEQFGRAGVPLYVLYPADGGVPQVLPQILDPGALERALKSAA